MPDIITSVNNERLKAVALLQNKKKARDEKGLFVVEGARIVEDALVSALDRIEDIYVSETFFVSGGMETLKAAAGKRAAGLDESARDRLKVTVVSDNAFGKISETVSPQGVLAVIRKQDTSVADILKKACGPARILLLDDIQDPGNLGTMMRTAEAAGISGVIFSKNTVEIYSPKATRSTMGSIFRVPFTYAEGLPETIEDLKNRGFSIYGTYLTGSKAYDSVSYAEKTAIVIGNEGKGISDAVIAHVDERIRIPMQGQVESLNAAIAAAIVMYESRL